MAEIRTTIYSKELQKQLYPDNSFVKKSVVERGVDVNAKTVEKPVQGKINKAKEGEPTSLPLNAYNATDSKHTYPTTLIYCEPMLIDSQSELMTNYNKRQSKQEQQAEELNAKVAAYTAQHWCSNKSENILKTSGTARKSNVAGFSSQRKAVTKDDFIAVHNLMMRQSLGRNMGNWYGMLTPDMYTDLLKIEDFVDYSKTGNETKLREGIIGRILGIELFMRSTEEGHCGVLYNSNTPLSGDTQITDDLLSGALFWHSKAVCRAEGVVKTIINENAPGYMGGTLIESFMRYGADIIRDDHKGVITLLEAK